ncbi:hypothetical protein [Thermogymnomonas acidicola]|nr:hypothetical protein [Thermogymnomonas acidicola]
MAMIRVGQPSIRVSWAWYDQASGIVEWKLRNVGGGKGSVILIRDGYVFGGAFWPVYLKVFGFPVTMDDAPLVNMGPARNNPPLGVLTDPDGHGQVGFVFTLSAGEAYSTLEGGFSTEFTPDSFGKIEAISVIPESVHTFIITYNVSAQCEQYASQTGESISCPENPVKLRSMLWRSGEGFPIPFMDDIVQLS